MKGKQLLILAFFLPFAVIVSSCAQNLAKDASPQPVGKDEVTSTLTDKSLNFSDAPTGFAWQQFRDVVFLSPNGWFEHTMVSSDNGFNLYTYATSPTDFSVKDKFETGFTIEIFSDLYKNKGIKAKTMAAMLITSVKKEDILLLDSESHPGFELYYMRFKDETPGLTPIIVHRFMIANEQADAVHSFTFESPKDSWTKNWDEFGTPILKNIRLIMSTAQP